LKENQRESGRWWMYSLYRGNYNYITRISTAQALRALRDELPTNTSPRTSIGIQRAYMPRASRVWTTAEEPLR
jgi:hypothetical protein